MLILDAIILIHNIPIRLQNEYQAGPLIKTLFTGFPNADTYSNGLRRKKNASYGPFMITNQLAQNMNEINYIVTALSIVSSFIFL